MIFEPRQPSWILEKIKNSFTNLFVESISMSVPDFVQIGWTESVCRAKCDLWGQIWLIFYPWLGLGYTVNFFDLAHLWLIISIFMLKKQIEHFFLKKMKIHAVAVDFLTKNSKKHFFQKMTFFVRKCFIVP